MKLIFKILKYIEKHHKDRETVLAFDTASEFETRTPYEIEYHLGLCEQAGYIEFTGGSTTLLQGVYRLTWEGHEVLDRFRNEEGSC